MGLTGNILITGGTGTLGQALVRAAHQDSWACQITVFSRSESRQAAMRARWPGVRYLLGDVRDERAVLHAVAGHDIVIHAAALKRIPECEAQPSECLATNVLGTQHVADACISHTVQTAVFISTDKACRAITHYGASKLMGETIWRAAATAAASDGRTQIPAPTRFVGVRYGNVIDSTGSVIPLWREQFARREPLTLTDERMTRFWMTPQDAVAMIELAATSIPPGMIIVPKLKAMAIVDMARALFGSDVAFTTTGLRSLEKLHEDLVHPEERAADTRVGYLLGEGQPGHQYTSAMCPRITPALFRDMLASVEQEAIYA